MSKPFGPYSKNEPCVTSTYSERSNTYLPASIDEDGGVEYIFPVRRVGDRVLYYVIEEWNNGVVRLAVRVWDGEAMYEPAKYEDAFRILNKGTE